MKEQIPERLVVKISQIVGLSRTSIKNYIRLILIDKRIRDRIIESISQRLGITVHKESPPNRQPPHAADHTVPQTVEKNKKSNPKRRLRKKLT